MKFKFIQTAIIIFCSFCLIDNLIIAQNIEPLYNVPQSDIEYGGSNILWSVSQLHSAIKLDLTNGTILDTIHFNIPVENDGRGIAWDGNNFWYSEWALDTLYVIDPTNGNPIYKYLPPGNEPQGLAYGGGYIWHTDEETEDIYKIDPANGSVVGTLPNPETDGYFVGIAYYNGTLWLSNAITHNFFQIDATTGNILSSFSFESQGDITSDANYLYFCSGGVLHRMPLGVVSVDDNILSIPEEYNLYQNYPNPFNPSTRIQYQVSSISQVVLKVYDVLGKEVATLVNEEQPAGEYEVEFSASGGPASDNWHLASGIYFYQLKAGEFVSTKKMILLR